MEFEMHNGIMVPVEPPKPQQVTHLCVLCQRPVEMLPFGRDSMWPTCGHGRYGRHDACIAALETAFPMTDMESRHMAFSQAGCPVCGCGWEYT